MRPIVIEDFIEGKRKEPSKCEDGFIVTDDYAVMIDGATSKSDMDFGGRTSARYIMEKIKEFVKDFDDDLDEVGFIGRVNEKLQEDYKENGWLEAFEAEPRFRPTASMVIYSFLKKEIWFYGDCRALLVGVDGETTQINNEKWIDVVTSSARKLYLEALLRKGYTVEQILESDEGRTYIDPMLKFQQLFQNAWDEGHEPSDFDYSAVDGWNFPEHQIKKIEVDVEKYSQVVLSTDGYVDLKDNLGETELLLKKQLEEDPLSIYKLLNQKAKSSALNSFDDRAYLRFRV